MRSIHARYAGSPLNQYAIATYGRDQEVIPEAEGLLIAELKSVLAKR
jgi:hypothetical protein